MGIQRSVLYITIASASAAVGLQLTARASCVRDANPSNCCSVVDTFDRVGNCTPWAHSCPDVAIQNPAILRTAQAHSGHSRVERAEFQCEYQPKKCKFIGCENDGEPASAGCFSEWPAGDTCSVGPNTGQVVPIQNPEPKVVPAWTEG